MTPSTTIFTQVAIPAVALIALALVGFLVFGSLTWRHAMEALRARVVGADRSPPVGYFHAADVEGLPKPVARYLRFALEDGRRRIRTARLASEGEFRRGETADAWVPFQAEQLFTTTRPGFVWDARMRMVPGVAVRVLDAYVEGRGHMKAAIAGLITVAEAPDTPTLATGELMRWLAETPWLPTALLPGGCVEWTAIDDERARATVRDGDLTVSAEFRFGSEGEVVEVFVPERPREVDGAFVATPWSGRFDAYEEHDGVRIPGDAVVQWHVTGGELPYWRGRITGVAYDVEEASPTA